MALLNLKCIDVIFGELYKITYTKCIIAFQKFFAFSEEFAERSKEQITLDLHSIAFSHNRNK